MIKKIQFFFNQFSFFSPLLRFLAFLKNDYFKKNKIELLLMKTMPKNFKKMKIVDLGSGPCKKEQDLSLPNLNITCVDIYASDLKVCKTLGYKTIHADIRRIEKYFTKKSVDIIWMLDVIEHLTRSDGLKLLVTLEKIARKQIIIFTPSGDMAQDMLRGNVYQKHLSAWFKKDFEKSGYHCRILKNFHRDIRPHAKRLTYKTTPISQDALWAFKNISSI